MLEIKLDAGTMFEWHQAQADVPHYNDLLSFVNLRAQAAESSVQQAGKRSQKPEHPVKRPANAPRQVTTFATNIDLSVHCSLCKADKHPLYVCPSFRAMNHSDKVALLKERKACMNCLSSGHFAKNCKSSHRCTQRAHHTLLHVDDQRSGESSAGSTIASQTSTATAPTIDTAINVSTSHAAIILHSNTLLMICKVFVTAPDGTSIEARALLDNASSASFISERIAQHLRLPRSTQKITVSGIAGLQRKAPIQAVTRFSVSPVSPSSKRLDVIAIIVPRVTCDLPLCPVYNSVTWSHVSDLTLADRDWYSHSI